MTHVPGYTEFDPNKFKQPALKPKVRICAISDTHEQWNDLQIPVCDLLIVAGDITYEGNWRKIIEFNDWLARLKDADRIKEAVVIAGNHDLTAEKDPVKFRELLTEAVYLDDEEQTVMGLRIHGSPWTPWFHDWAFNAHRGAAIKAHWDKIQPGIDILVTHGPAFGVRDEIPNGQRVGCVDLMHKVLEIQPKLHICGHIHHSYGFEYLGNTLTMNAAVCTEKYKPTNPPLLITI